MTIPSSNADTGDGSSDSRALPVPDKHALEHSQRLQSQLKERLATEPMSFADYMSAVLYTPGLGYYMAGSPKFGAGGDFITAPEISPLFGASLAVQCREVLADIGGGILELGAGNGRLAAGLLNALSDIPNLQYSILEPSAELQRRQRDFLKQILTPGQFERLRWIVQLPESFKGIVVANEVMDAMPVERFRMTNEVQQLFVKVDSNQRICDYCQPATVALKEAVVALETDLGYRLPAGYTSEISLLLSPWIKSLAATLEQGVVLLIDYGYPRREYYLPERNQGTLACYYRHRMHDDPYYLPGLQDITAHVDFTCVAEAAVQADLSLLGYAAQSAFLLANDLLLLADAEMSAATREMDRIAVAQAVKTLTLPGEMGERFQVIALGKNHDCSLRGFQQQDLSHRL